MNEKFDQFNKIKSAAEKNILIGGGIAIVGFLLAFLLQQVMQIGIVVVVVGIIIAAIGGDKFRKLNIRFKNEILSDLITKNVDEGIFDAKGGLTKDQVYSTEFLKRADRFHTEDYISGKIEDVKFISSDVKLEERHVERTKNGTRTYYVTYFLGRVFIFDFNKEFDGYLQVLESDRPKSNKKFTKVKLESIEFNKKFRTYSSSEHTAFYILTPQIMEAILKLERENPGKILLSFYENRLYIGINNNKDTFKLQLFKAVTDETIKKFEQELLVIKDVIVSLKLNNNIFKKER